MPVSRLTEEQLQAFVANHTGWCVKDAKLHREFKFPDFPSAFGFMTTAAIHIEKANHHPEWFNVYGRVTVDLTTHDSGGITQRDVDLALLLDKIAAKLA